MCVYIYIYLYIYNPKYTMSKCRNLLWVNIYI